MWSQYDEDLSQNIFFKEIKQNHGDILEKASEENWIICIPRSGSFKSEDISMNVILDHVLVQNTETDYNTLSKKAIHLDNHHLKVDQNNIFHSDIEVLFEETHYIEKTAKYLVWCISWPLFFNQHQKHCINNNNVTLTTIQNCIDFLYSEAFGHNLLEDIQKLCISFWKSHENNFETETLQGQKDYIGNLYSQCLQLCFKMDFIRDKCEKNMRHLENFKLAIETYMQYCFGRKLIYSINTVQHSTDSLINKIVRNSINVTLSDLNISSDFCDFVNDAKYELSRINNSVTVLDKLYCLSRTFNVFHNKSLQNDKKLYVTSDDFLQILVYLILNCNIPNWKANLTYLKEFQFAMFCNPDQTNFLITSLEAAIEFIKSSQFFDIKQSLTHPSCDQSSVFDKLYNNFKTNKNLAELDTLLADEKEKHIAKPCHPLCSCQKCEKIRNENVDEKPYKIVNNFNQNFIITASIKNDPNFLEFLLSFDYDIDFKDNFDKTAIHYAAEKGFQDILLLLINATANVNIFDNDRNTPLHLACDRGHDNCVKALIYSSHYVEINLQNISGETPMFLATRWGYFEIIKLLLESGASVCIKNNRNMSIYKLSSNYYITKLFRQFGTQKSTNILEEVIKDKDTPLASTPNISEDCCNKVYSTLQEQGVLFGMQPKTASDHKKIGLLLKAIVNNDTPLTCFYLGYTTSKSTEDYNGEHINKCHPLCACSQCSKDTTDSTLEESGVSIKKDCKFNVNMCDKEGFTPLHIAAQFGRTEIVRVLLDGGAFVNVRNHKTLYTPLHLAAMSQRVQTVKELLKSGDCHVDAQDFQGNTPLYYACIRNNNNMKIIESLLQNGASCQKKNFKKKSVLQVCEEKNLFRVCRVLRESLGYSSPKTKEEAASSSSLSTDSLVDIESEFVIL